MVLLFEVVRVVLAAESICFLNLSEGENKMKGEYYYETLNQDGFIRLITNYMGQGFEEFHVGYIPIKKMAKVDKIDQKLIIKYKTRLNSRQRNYRKSKGECVFVYLRFQHIFVILKSSGELPKNIKEIDRFENINDSDLIVVISEFVSFKIKKHSNKITVFLGDGMIKNNRDVTYDFILKRNKTMAVKTFQMLNGFPRFSGIIYQQIQLQREIVQLSKKHNLVISKQDLVIRTRNNNTQIYKK